MQDRPHSLTETTELILPARANHYGTLFAGDALSMMANAAYTAASRYVRGNVVLARVSEVDLTAPVPVGSLLTLRARIVSCGRSAVLVDVTGLCEQPETGQHEQVAQGQFNMVAVDKDGRPKAINTQESCR
ncbi:MAG: acyl-CoA thioesterase [Paracoccus sp. (in: a-proteobacteria)]